MLRGGEFLEVDLALYLLLAVALCTGLCEKWFQEGVEVALGLTFGCPDEEGQQQAGSEDEMLWKHQESLLSGKYFLGTVPW
jgi:hypothetical protein